MRRAEKHMPAFAGTFTARPVPSIRPREEWLSKPYKKSSRTCSMSQRGGPSSDLSMLYTRRTVLSAFGALCGLSAGARLQRAGAAESVEQSLQALQRMRTRVNDIDDLITSAKWDAVRTVLATPPVTGAKEACAQLLQASTQDTAGAVVGLREDLFSAIRLLDTSVYSNVFVGEDRQVLGTKVDYDVPRVYLADLKDTLDALIDLAAS